jgi:hypothetical protein
MRRYLSILACSAVLGSALAISGCDSSTDAPGVDVWRNPESGTILVFREVKTMTLDGRTTTTSSNPAYEFLATELQMWGENNVSKVLDPNGDTLYIALRENGDFAIGDSGVSGVHWDIYPTGTRQTITVHDYDSVTNGTDHEIRKMTREFAGEEELEIADKRFYVIKVVQNETQRLVSEGLWDFLTTATDTLYFAPDFGFYIQHRGSVTNYEFDSLTSTHTTTLDLQAYIKK